MVLVKITAAPRVFKTWWIDAAGVTRPWSHWFASGVQDVGIKGWVRVDSRLPHVWGHERRFVVQRIRRRPLEWHFVHLEIQVPALQLIQINLVI